MNTVIQRPRSPDFSDIQQNGVHEAQNKYEAICSSHPTDKARYKELKDAYAKYTGIFNHAAENFYPDNYASRQVRDSDVEIKLIELANRSKGILDGLIFSLYAESKDSPRLERDFAVHSSKHIAVCNNMQIANEVFLRRGVLPEESEGVCDVSFPWRVARITASIFGKPQNA